MLMYRCGNKYIYIKLTSKMDNDELNEFSIDELTSELKGMLTNTNLDKASNDIFERLVKDVAIGFIFEVHSGYRNGRMVIEDGLQEDDSTYIFIDKPDVDIFGLRSIKKSQDCICPNCERLVAASRFAPHLEKCMGMGRNSSRIASRRIANNSRESSANYVGTGISDDDDDGDWLGEKRKKKGSMKSNGSKKITKSSHK